MFQQRGQQLRARALAANIFNRRRHFLHLVSHGLVQHYGEICLGDVSAGWSMLCNMPSYKSIATGGTLRIVCERYSSQTCPACRCRSASSPKELGALGVRQ